MSSFKQNYKANIETGKHGPFNGKIKFKETIPVKAQTFHFLDKHLNYLKYARGKENEENNV